MKRRTPGVQRAGGVVRPLKVYRLLLRHFGPQGWWPTAARGKLVSAYRPLRYVRRQEAEKFEICLGALLTQNTAWTNVEKALVNLRRKGMASCAKIAAASRSRLARLIRPSGYYNQKARYVKSFARHLSRSHRGSCAALLQGPAESARRELLSLPGIGPETADSMLLYAGGKPVFVVDAYTRRVGKRLGWFVKDDYDKVQSFFHESVPSSVPVYNEFHALIVALCKDHCRTKPRCGACPVRHACKKRGVA